MSLETALATSLGVVFGGLITWFAAWWYYKKAGSELVAEARKLKQTTDLVLYKLQFPNAQTELKRGPTGEVEGLVVDMAANISGEGNLSAKPSNEPG